MAGENGGSGETFLNIPGNIKQKNLPFVLDPSNTINSQPIDIAENGKAKKNIKIDSTAKAQVFSFRPAAFGEGAASSAESAGFLRIAPGSFYNENGGDKVSYTKPDHDLSYQLLYKNCLRAGNESSSSINAQNILNSLPSISVREYLQDSKLNQVINLFQSIIGGWDDGTKLAQEAKEASNESFASKVLKFAKALMTQLPQIMSDSIRKVTVVNASDFAGGTDADEKNYIMTIPFALYYRMISATTTNIYELPYNGKIMYQSDGAQGWNKDNGIGGFSTDGKSMVGQVLNYLGGNIKVNTTPTWTPKPDGQPTKVELTFDLYNDTLEGALKNFIFINTVVPSNKFLQYHIYQHSPDLYDVRIDGVNRLFMCAATVKVDQVGVLRIPSAEFFKKLTSHINNNFKIADPAALSQYIRIPDVYRVAIAFESLLPDTFNNYIYQYYINSPIPTKIEGNDLRTGSAYIEFANAISESVSTLWNNPDGNTKTV